MGLDLGLIWDDLGLNLGLFQVCCGKKKKKVLKSRIREADTCAVHKERHVRGARSVSRDIRDPGDGI